KYVIHIERPAYRGGETNERSYHQVLSLVLSCSTSNFVDVLSNCDTEVKTNGHHLVELIANTRCYLPISVLVYNVSCPRGSGVVSYFGRLIANGTVKQQASSFLCLCRRHSAHSKNSKDQFFHIVVCCFIRQM